MKWAKAYKNKQVSTFKQQNQPLYENCILPESYRFILPPGDGWI